MDNKQLEEIESFATQLCYDAGQILLDYFQKPISVDYKSKDQTNPVTEADKRSEEYLKESIMKAFPGHGILAEEGSQVNAEDSDCIWVIDPLDGTTNFINGFPIFGVSIGVLDKGVPVVGCVFLPSPKDVKGDVFHARNGGGAYRNSEAINVSSDKKPRRSRVSVFPVAYQQSFKFKDEFRKSFGDLRSPGSTVYEIVMTACGSMQYAMFANPWIWDVAAGIVLVKEAGGVALNPTNNYSLWESFTGFRGADGTDLTPADLESCRSPWLFSNSDIASFITRNLIPRSSLGKKVSSIMRRWF